MGSEKDKVLGKYLDNRTEKEKAFDDNFDKYSREKSYQGDTRFVLRNIDRQYEKLCHKIRTSDVVQGVSAAVFGITAVALAGHSDFIDEIGANIDIFKEPASQLAMGVCAVSALACFVAHKIQEGHINKAARLEGVYEHFEDKLIESENITTEMEENGALIPPQKHETAYARDLMSRVNQYHEELEHKDENPREDLADIDVPDFMKQAFNQDDGQGQ